MVFCWSLAKNRSREAQLSLNGNITISMSKAWNLVMNSNLQYTNLQNISNTMLQNNGLSGSFGISNTLQVNKKFTISTFFGNFKPPIGLQGYTSSQWFYNITPSYKFFKDKLVLTIAAARFFSNYVTVKTVQSDPNFHSENLNSFQARNLRLGIIWNFGKLTEKVSRKKGINNDDVL
ncbi:outer membrane beta-barrel protein [Mucilaginibacter pineti]|uniref:outer membrane beta-barrel protein n=1 Tax=Mucilaginibacter pineti TaxID=1391627 RepID=UPI000B84246F|nr:outer membrane beta-barrel protein [Mucilaginibacter pineti]